ncbi:ankyrin repeat domain-containing protein 26-like isoform X2 [Lepus europaeus]|uniref:ankyrin repeat domain-containing protein 26-like isoform X2 n=1 Tax=Lepus europaeus TaxID=9983 RepID=UPI002B475484|nr:ankyrin repeat domain-containing protein 26-like isoform X2 [Lepus europaeus]
MEVLNLHESAAPPDESDGCGLNQQRKSGDLDNQQSATKKNEEYYSEQLRRKEKQYHKEVEVKQLEVTHRTLEMDARTSENNLTQVSPDDGRSCCMNSKMEIQKLKKELSDLRRQVSPHNVGCCCMNSKIEIQHLKKELSDLRRQLQTLEHTRKHAAQEEWDRELEEPSQLHVQVGETLTCNLNKAHEKSTVVRTEFLEETQRNESLPSTSTMRPALPSSSVGNVHGGLMCEGNFVPQRNLRIPTSQLQLSRNRTLDSSCMKKASCQKSSEYLMESDDISKSIQKEHRIHAGISKLSKMKAPQEYKQLLLEGFEALISKQDEVIQVAEAFSKQVNEAKEVLAEVRTKNFLLEKQQTGTLTKSVTTQTSVASHSVGSCANSFWLSRDLTPQQNLETPTSATQASHHNTAESLDTVQENCSCDFSGLLYFVVCLLPVRSLQKYNSQQDNAWHFEMMIGTYRINKTKFNNGLQGEEC